MTDLWQDIQQKLKDLLGGWASYAALGSFVLYVLGYLAIRFHLTALGIGTDLSVLDERYVFAGTKFLVYFFSNLPIVILFALPLVLVALVLRWIFRKLLTLFSLIIRKLRTLFNFQSKSEETTSPDPVAKRKWFSTPNRAAFLGILLSVLMIQIVMRKSFWFSNILLEGIPDSGIWLESLLHPNNDKSKLFYFLALLLGTTICATVWLYARGLPGRNSLSKYLIILLACLVFMQFLFLPIYYGVFVMDKSIPRVVDLGDQVSLAKNQKAWLIWEGNQGSTYLIHETDCSTPEQKDVMTPNAGATPPSSTAQSQTTNAQLPAYASPTAVSTPSNSQANSQTPAGPVTQTNQMANFCTVGATVSPDGVIRKLVTLQQKDSKRIQILGYDSIATLSFFRKDDQP